MFLLKLICDQDQRHELASSEVNGGTYEARRSLRVEAEKQGWNIEADTGHALCPACVAKARKG